jgi:PKD repeat protein
MKNLFYLTATVLISTMLLCGCEEDEDSIEVKACFNYTITEVAAGEVQFVNCSENAKSYLWDFGDSTTSTEKEPKHIFSGSFPFIVSLTAINGKDRDTLSVVVSNNIMLYKPNIYIYPTSPVKLCLEVAFPQGGSITKSIPEYNNGWCVDVDSNGMINNEFNYLFYESIQPDIFQYRNGWCVAKADLKTFFEDNMASYNFSSNEIADFTDYWIPKLTESAYYLIYPQTNNIIDEIIQLNFSILPEHVNRLFYGVVGATKYAKMEEPSIIQYNRDGFFVMEWGVFMK